jgi:hypothetical protein
MYGIYAAGGEGLALRCCEDPVIFGASVLISKVSKDWFPYGISKNKLQKVLDISSAGW